MKMSTGRLLCAFVSAALCVQACVKKNQEDSLTNAAGEVHSAAEKTACLSVFGNGYLFPAHLGAMTAMLENNIRPIVASGNSVATITTSLLRGLLQNKTLANAAAGALTQSQRAARILSASMPVYKTILFPAAGKAPALTLSAIKSATGIAVLNQIVGDMGRALFTAHVPLAYGMMAIDFFSTADFSAAAGEANFKKRQSIVRDLWIAHTGSLAVDSTTYINDLLRPLADSSDSARAFTIKKRYHEIISGSIFNGQAVTKENLPEFEKKYKTLSLLIKPVKAEALGKIFSDAVSQSVSLPIFGTNANFFGRDILLPDPQRLVQSVKGLTKSGGTLAIPGGTIIHASARELDEAGQEKSGLENLFHLYFPANDLYQDLQAKRNALDPLDSFLGFAKETGVIVPKERLVVLKNIRAVDAVRVSIAEPDLFSREVLTVISEQDWSRNTGALKRRVSGFGGWFDTVSLSTLSHLEECRTADVFVFIARPELNDFAKQIFRGVVLGGRVNPLQPIKDKEADTALDRYGRYFNFSRTRPSRLGTIALDFDWARPSQFQQNDTYIGNKRTAIFLQSYFDAVKKLRASALGKTFVPNKDAAPFDPGLSDPGFATLKTKEEIGTIADRVFE